MIANLRQTLVNSALEYVGVTGGTAPGDDIFISYYNQLAGTSFSVNTTPWCAIFMTYEQLQKKWQKKQNDKD